MNGHDRKPVSVSDFENRQLNKENNIIKSSLLYNIFTAPPHKIV